MVFSSLIFLYGFFSLSLLAYSLCLSRKAQNWVLLVFSLIFYAWGEPKYVLLLMFMAFASWACALGVERASSRRGKRLWVLLAAVVDIGLIGYFKYAGLICGIFGTVPDFIRSIALPIGISFYTFQSMGYLLDVYWKKTKAEKNLFRFALFLSFFPQILQGPIGRHSRLACQLYEKRRWEWKRAEEGVQRILWGFFKKLVLADTAAPFVDALFDQYQTYSGLAVFAVLAYSIQLYGDFSGGMDIVIGVGKLFGITLDENFQRPYFARSITDFWHRWHITLGTWMKDYVFYPVSLSRWMNRFGKWSKKIFGRSTGRTLPICLANLIVFFVVGVWHGAAWKYIIYGMYNGFIIAFSGLMALNYRKWKKVCHIQEKSAGWQVFQILRTFLLINISWFFDRADTVSQAFSMMKNSVTQWSPGKLLQIPIGQGGTTDYTIYALAILILGVMVLFIFSFFEEKGINLFSRLMKAPVVLRGAVYLGILLCLPIFSQYPALTGGFIYAQF